MCTYPRIGEVVNNMDAHPPVISTQASELHPGTLQLFPRKNKITKHFEISVSFISL